MFTPADRDRAADCRQMAERAPNMRVQGILLDIARTWTRLALEAEQWSQMNRPRTESDAIDRRRYPFFSSKSYPDALMSDL
jgi:hypothetical protein